MHPSDSTSSSSAPASAPGLFTPVVTSSPLGPLGASAATVPSVFASGLTAAPPLSTIPSVVGGVTDVPLGPTVDSMAMDMSDDAHLPQPFSSLPASSVPPGSGASSTPSTDGGSIPAASRVPNDQVRSLLDDQLYALARRRDALVQGLHLEVANWDLHIQTITGTLSLLRSFLPSPTPVATSSVSQPHLWVQLTGRSIPKLRENASSEEMDAWASGMEDFLRLVAQQTDSTPSDAEMRSLWNQALPSTDVRFKMFKSNIFSEGRNAGDPLAVLEEFRARYLAASPMKACAEFDRVVWSSQDEFPTFVEQFRYRALQAGFSLEDPKTRSFLAHRFLQCLPPSFNVTSVMTLHRQAPPLPDLILAARQEAASSSIRFGTGRLLRPDAYLVTLHSPSPAPHLVAPSVVPLPTASSPRSSSPVASSGPQFRGDYGRNKRAASSSAGPAPKRQLLDRSSPSDTQPRRAFWCYRCNAGDHYSSDCNDELYLEKGAFRPVNGQRPVGGRRGESSNLRIGSLHLPSSSDLPSDLARSSSSSWAWDQYDDEECSLLRARLVNKVQLFDALSISTVRVVRLLDVSSSSCILLDVVVEGVPLVAVIDTGSNTTCVSTRALSKLDVAIIPAAPNDAPIQLAHADTLVRRIGVTSPVSIALGDKVISHYCEILDMPLGYDLLVGLDTFYRLGLGIHGLPAGRAIPSSFSAPMDYTDRVLVPASPSAQEASPTFVAKREEFMQGIRLLLEDNARIPRDSFCTLPASVVDLPTTPGKVTYLRQYPIPIRQHAFVDAALDEWLANKTVVPLSDPSPFNIPLILVGKKDDNGVKTDLRPCLDPRMLNLLLPDDSFPLPLIKDIFSDLNGCVIFSTIDLTKAYHRFPIRKADQHKTAFTWRGRQFVFQGAPFGIKTLPSKFQRVMSQLLGDLPFARFFIDDIIVFSRSLDEHLQHVQAVLSRLNHAGLIVNPKKCNFFRTELLLLGFLVSTQGIRPDPKKLANIDDWPRPVTKQELQSFLGFANYFREHIPFYAHVSRPLDKLRNHRDLCSVWGSTEQRAFDELKTLLASAQVLSFPDFSLPFFVATDASDRGLGAVLYQGDKGSEKYISFVARALTAGEEGYGATQKEMAAIVFALQRFRNYLWGTHFTLFTDHNALVFLRKQKASMIPLFVSWWGTLGEFDFDIIHRPGIENTLPDHLSRFFPKVTFRPQLPMDASTSFAIGETNSLISSAIAPPTPVPIISYLHVDPATVERQVVPEADRPGLLLETHALGHFGANAMVDRIHEDGKTWSNMKQDCLDVVRKCAQCQRFNISKRGYHPLHPIHAQLPGDHMAIDLAGPFVPSDYNGQSFSYMLLLIDVCTRFVYLRPLVSKSASSVASALFTLFCDIGFPRILQSDNGTEFKNDLLLRLAEKMGIERRFVTPYHPRGNGVAERYIGTTVRTVRKLVQGNSSVWASALPAVQFAINTKVAALHRSTPYSLFFGRRLNTSLLPDLQSVPVTEDELLQRIEYLHEVVFPAVSEASKSQQARMVSRFSGPILKDSFPDGSYVMAIDPTTSSKLQPVYEGPFLVVRRTSGGSYVLQDASGALTPRNYAPSQLKPVDREPLDGQSYAIEAVLDHREGVSGAEPQYFVRWKGYGSKWDSWEPFSNFDDIACINDYFRRRGQIPNHPPRKVVSPPNSVQKPLQNPLRQNPKRRFAPKTTVKAVPSHRSIRLSRRS